MNIPMTVNDRIEYRFVKAYPNFVLYESEAGFKTCYDWHDLGMVKSTNKESSKLYKIPKI